MAAAGAGPELRCVGFVGAGRMAEAIAQGLIRAGGSRGGVRRWPGAGRWEYLAGAHLPTGMNPAEPLGEEPGASAQGSQGGAGPGRRGPGWDANPALGTLLPSDSTTGRCAGRGLEPALPTVATSCMWP